jgi:mannose-1-phosphate guanylyltransferase/phosphomannomutase
MKAVVMAGGFGTRIQPLTASTPKPMLPVINKPMMEYIIEMLKNSGITEIVILLYFKPEVIKNYFGDGSDFGIKIHYVLPDDDYGTAGAVKKAEKYLDERFIIVSGDLVTDFNFREIIGFHEINNSKATITLTSVDDPLQFGVVITDKDRKILRFLEKPGWGEVFSDTINTGIYVFEPEILSYIPENKAFDFSKDLFPTLMNNKITIFGYNAKGYWRDVGNPNSYREVLNDILSGKIKIHFKGNKLEFENGVLYKGKNVDLKDDIKVLGTVVVDDNVSLNNKLVLENCVIGKGTKINSNTKIKNSVIWNNVAIDKNCKINNSVLCNNVILGQNVMAKQGCIIAENTEVGNYVVFEKDVMVWPNKQIEEESIISSNMIWGDKWKKKIFEGGKVSARTNVEMTVEVGAKLGTALGSILPKGSSVLLSRDYHRASRMVKRSFLGGLLSAGVNVVDMRMTPIPVMRYILANGPEIIGAHIRQSANDPTHTEILFYDKDGIEINASVEKSIENYFFRENFRRVSHDEIGNISDRPGLTETYLKDFTKLIDTELIRTKHFKVVIDLLNGTTSGLIPSLLNDFGVDTVVLNAYHDEKKLSRTISKTKETLLQSASIFKSLDADIGFILYPHGERIQFITSEGKILNKHKALFLILSLINSTVSKKVKVYLPAMSPHAFDKLLNNIDIIRGKLTGIKADYIKQFYMIADLDCSFVFPEISYAADGLFTTVKTLEMMAKSSIDTKDIMKNYPDIYYMHYSINCPEDKKGFLMRKMSEEAADKDASFIDGVKITFGNKSWILVVPDQNNSNIHLYVESSDKKEGDYLSNYYKEKINGWLNE